MSITQDATSLKYIPQSSSEWTSLLSGSGISNPALLWMFNQTSGACLDQIGSINGTVSGPFAGPTYLTTVTGWATKGILFHNGNNDKVVSNDTGLPDVSTTSMLVLMWAEIPNVFRGLLNVGLRGNSPQQTAYAAPVGSGNQFQVSTHAGQNDTFDADGGVHCLALQVNRAAPRVSLTTDSTQVTTTFDGSLNGKEICVGASDFGGGSGDAAGGSVLYMAAWFGSAAELTLTQLTSLVSLMSTGPVASPVSISIAPSSDTVGQGQTASLVATEHYSDSSTVNVTTTAAWTTADSGIATVGASTGVVTGVSPGGPINITATKDTLSSSSAIMVVKVPTGISLAPTSLAGSGSLTATEFYSDSSSSDVTLSAVWASSDVTIATVVGGVVTSVGPGVAQITATKDTLVGTVSVTVGGEAFATQFARVDHVSAAVGRLCNQFTFPVVVTTP